MNDIVVIMTCHNRSKMTVACVNSLSSCADLSLSFIIVDDDSSDDTLYELEKLSASGVKITVLHGSGNLYYSGGMRIGISHAKDNTTADYYLLVNDDVEFLPDAVEKMVKLHGGMNDGSKHILVGCTCSDQGDLTYGGVVFDKKIHSRIIGPKEDSDCDTFNANCVLIPKEVFFSTPNIDPVYRHSLGDYDYGLSVSRNGNTIKTFDDYVGICNDNNTSGTWQDKSLGMFERIRLKENVKGAPFKQWFYFLRKNFGIFKAILHSFTPYIRIMLKK